MCCFFKKRSTCQHSVWLLSWKLAHIIGSALHRVSRLWCHRAVRRCGPSVHLRHLEKQTLKKLCPHQSPGGPGRLVWRQHARVARGDCISVSVAVLTPEVASSPLSLMALGLPWCLHVGEAVASWTLCSLRALQSRQQGNGLRSACNFTRGCRRRLPPLHGHHYPAGERTQAP